MISVVWSLSHREDPELTEPVLKRKSDHESGFVVNRHEQDELGEKAEITHLKY